MKKPIKLSKTETVILMALAAGKTPILIAYDRSCSKRTIDFHQANIYRKLRVQSKWQAIHEARALGLIK